MREYESWDATAQRWFANRVFPNPDGSLSVYFQDITERKLTAQQLEQDQAALMLLQSLSTKLVPAGDLHTLLGEIVAASAELTGTSMGRILLWDPTTQRLPIAAHQGYGAALRELLR